MSFDESSPFWELPQLQSPFFLSPAFAPSDDISDIGFQFLWDTLSRPGRILENDNLNHMQVGSDCTIVYFCTYQEKSDIRWMHWPAFSTRSGVIFPIILIFSNYLQCESKKCFEKLLTSTKRNSEWTDLNLALVDTSSFL